MSNKRILGNEFQTAYESAGGTDILKFLAECQAGITSCISGLNRSNDCVCLTRLKVSRSPQLLVQQLDQTTFAESAGASMGRRFAALCCLSDTARTSDRNS